MDSGVLARVVSSLEPASSPIVTLTPERMALVMESLDYAKQIAGYRYRGDHRMRLEEFQSASYLGLMRAAYGYDFASDNWRKYMAKSCNCRINSDLHTCYMFHREHRRPVPHLMVFDPELMADMIPDTNGDDGIELADYLDWRKRFYVAVNRLEPHDRGFILVWLDMTRRHSKDFTRVMMDRFKMSKSTFFGILARVRLKVAAFMDDEGT